MLRKIKYSLILFSLKLVSRILLYFAKNLRSDLLLNELSISAVCKKVTHIQGKKISTPLKSSNTSFKNAASRFGLKM